MNNQLLLGVLLVTLSWGFMGASAQSSSNSTSNTTVASTSTSGPNTTVSLSANTATVASTSTSGPNTTVSLSANTATVASASPTNSSIATTPSAAGATNATASNQLSANTTSNAAAGNATNSNTTASNASASNTTASNASASNTTASNASASNTTASNASASNTTASNASASNTTASNASASNTTASNASASNTTASNASASNTTASNTTTSNSTTTNATASATTSFSVGALQTPISKTNCGSSKLCVAAPSSCDPSTGSGCYFISAQQQSGQLYNFELSGQTDGYIAAGVSTASNQNGTNQAYICLNNNSAVNFFTGTINNLLLTLTQLNASNVKGSVSSNKVQCTFAATLPDTTTRAAAYSLSVSTGTYNSSSGTFGSPSFKIFTNQVNLSDPNANATNQINGAYPVTYQQPLIPALLVTVIMLTFSAL